MLEKKIACVTVGFPATGLTGGRVRFCLSAAHTRQMLDKVSRLISVSHCFPCVRLLTELLLSSLNPQQALEEIDVCGHMCGVRYSQLNPHRTLKQVREWEKSLESKMPVNFEKTAQ